MISLCITTKDRYNDFLSEYIPKYLENPYIQEIIISDENGNDFNKIKEQIPCNSRLRLYKNEVILGPFLNKLQVLKKAKNEWIALIDSDNFANIDYFEVAIDYIKRQSPNEFSILLPSFAKPNFDYRKFEDNIITKDNIRNVENIDKSLFNTLINTGNYVINKNLIDLIDISKENEDLISSSHACDVKYFNTLVLEQFPSFQLHVIKDLHYSHMVHNNSIYLQTSMNMKYRNTINVINSRFDTFIYSLH
jgi:hypothetical protein